MNPRQIAINSISTRTAAEIARRSDSPHVGVLFDTAHYHCTPTKFDQLNADSISLIKHVHIDDMQDKPGELSNCNSDRVLPGTGCLDLTAIIKQLENFGYLGYYAIALFNEELWDSPTEAAARKMYNSMIALCEGTARTR